MNREAPRLRKRIAPAAIAETQIQRARQELSNDIAAMLDQVRAMNTQAETAARARAEAIITRAGDWCARQVRVAVEQATTDLLAKVAIEREAAEAAAHRAGRYCAAIAVLVVAGGAAWAAARWLL